MNDISIVQVLVKGARLVFLMGTPEFSGSRGDLLDMDKVISDSKDLTDRWHAASKKQENILSCYLSQVKIIFIGGQNG